MSTIQPNLHKYFKVKKPLKEHTIKANNLIENVKSENKTKSVKKNNLLPSSSSQNFKEKLNQKVVHQNACLSTNDIEQHIIPKFLVSYNKL